METTNIAKTQIEVSPLSNMLNHTNGMYGQFGGSYIPPVLAKPLERLADFFDSEVRKDSFKREFIPYQKHMWVGPHLYTMQKD